MRAGAFRTAKGKSGFLGHTCLAVSADGARQPLGILGMIPVVRLDEEAAEASPGIGNIKPKAGSSSRSTAP